MYRISDTRSVGSDDGARDVHPLRYSKAVHKGQGKAISHHFFIQKKRSQELCCFFFGFCFCFFAGERDLTQARNLSCNLPLCGHQLCELLDETRRRDETRDDETAKWLDTHNTITLVVITEFRPFRPTTSSFQDMDDFSFASQIFGVIPIFVVQKFLSQKICIVK